MSTWDGNPPYWGEIGTVLGTVAVLAGVFIFSWIVLSNARSIGIFILTVTIVTIVVTMVEVIGVLLWLLIQYGGGGFTSQRFEEAGLAAAVAGSIACAVVALGCLLGAEAYGMAVALCVACTSLPTTLAVGALVA